MLGRLWQQDDWRSGEGELASVFVDHVDLRRVLSRRKTGERQLELERQRLGAVCGNFVQADRRGLEGFAFPRYIVSSAATLGAFWVGSFPAS